MRDGSDIRIYVDGVLGTITDTVGTLLDDSTNTWSVGRLPGPQDGRYFSGLIDEVRIYNRALSPDEIKRLYNLGR